MRDEEYTPFAKRFPTRSRLEDVLVFVMVRCRGELTDAMRGALRTGPHGYEAVYTLNGELDRSRWFAREARARADLAMQQDALAAAGWKTVAVGS